MKLYDKNGKLIIYNSLVFKEGTFAKIHLINKESCVKIYNKYSRHYMINPKIIKDINEINSNNKCDIYSYIYNKLEEKYDYMMKLYNINETSMNDINYIIDNIYRLEEYIIKLSEKNINIVDVRDDNTLITKKNIVLIDYDLFKYNYDSNLEKNNLIILSNLLKKLYPKYETIIDNNNIGKNFEKKIMG